MFRRRYNDTLLLFENKTHKEYLFLSKWKEKEWKKTPQHQNKIAKLQMYR